MTYADVTFKDRNRTKRWFQSRRLIMAANALPETRDAVDICDYGAGNGELVLLLADRAPNARFTCFEPTEVYLKQGIENLASIPNSRFISDIGIVADESMDFVFCLEVFEHLPPAETDDALTHIFRILRPGGQMVIGVPVEIGLPAIYKGAFRMARRFGAYDANPGNVLAASLGRPKRDRPIKEIAPGFHYHSHHTGFDYRTLSEKITARFGTTRTFTSPTGIAGPLWDAEIYFSASKPHHGA